jgi:hypothetical protein
MKTGQKTEKFKNFEDRKSENPHSFSTILQSNLSSGVGAVNRPGAFEGKLKTFVQAKV